MKLSLLIAAFALIVALPTGAKAADNNKTPMAEAESVMPAPVIKAITFHSDSCGSCKILKPRMIEAMEIINQDKVQAVTFDFTNKDTIAQTREIAKAQNVDAVLQKYGAKTGFVVLVQENGDIVETIKVGDNTAAIAAKLATAVANAS